MVVGQGRERCAFAALVRSDRIWLEWDLLRLAMAKAWYTHLANTPPCASADDREKQHERFRDEFYAPILEGNSYPELSVLIAIWCIEVLASVECERGFSFMCLVETKLQNRMSACLLDARMQICSNGPAMSDHDAVDAIVEAAVAHWKEARRRNVRKSHPGVAGRKPTPRDQSLDPKLRQLGRLANPSSVLGLTSRVTCRLLCA